MACGCPTAVSLQADVVRAQLFDRRRKLEALERRLGGKDGANRDAAAAEDDPDVAELLALQSEIRELETLAKSTGVFAAGQRSASGAGHPSSDK